MEAWLDFARGPAFRFAIVLFVLGLLRHIALVALSVRTSLGMAADRDLPGPALRRTTFAWLFPMEKLLHRPALSGFSVLFHIGVILAPLFLAGHVLLVERAVGISWPTLPALLADVLTLAAIVGLAATFAIRVGTREGRALSRPSDYALLAVVALPFLSGFLVMHPVLNPFPFAATLLVHALAGDVLLAIAPVTKLVHLAVFPGTQLVSEVGWRFRPDAGERVAKALGKEEQPV